MTSVLLGNLAVALAHGPDPARSNRPELLDRIGHAGQLGMRQVCFTGGSAAAGSRTSVTYPDCDLLRLTDDRKLRSFATNQRDQCAPKPMMGSWVAHGEGVVAPTHLMSTIGD